MPNYLPNAEPFFYPGNHVGCLLIHGFTGTPYEMRELGQRLAAQGYTVSGPALAGHATKIEDLVPLKWHDWYASVTTAYDELQKTCDVIFPIGLSLGANLALHLAAHRPVNGVVSVSAPFTLDNPLIPWFKTFPFLFDLMPFAKKKPQDNDTQDKTVAAHHPEYDSHPTRPAASYILDFLPHLHSDLGDIHAPALFLQGNKDATVPANAMQKYNERIGSIDKQMIMLDNSGHLVLEDFAKEPAFSYILKFVAAHIQSKPKFERRNYADVMAEFLR